MDFHNQNSAEGQSLAPNFKIDFDKKIKIKSPRAINKEELFEKIMVRLEEFEGKKKLSSDDLHSLFEQIKLLPEKSDFRLQCEFHYRNLKKKVQKTSNQNGVEYADLQNSLIELLRHAINSKELEQYFIQLKWPEFINIGSAGREKILADLIAQKKRFHNGEEIINFVKGETTRLIRLLDTIPNTKDKKKLLEQLNALKLDWFQKQSYQVKSLIAGIIVDKSLPTNLTLTTLDEYLQKVIKEETRLSTVPVELLKKDDEINGNL